MIRKLTISDFEKVEPMMAALHKIHVENRSDFYSENAHPITKKECKAMLKDKNKIALTFAENGEIAGIPLQPSKTGRSGLSILTPSLCLNHSVGGALPQGYSDKSRTLQARSVLKEWI